MKRTDEMDLDAALDALRDVDLAPSDAFLDRVMADADSVLEARSPTVQTPANKGSFWTFLQDIVGGWPQAGGLAMATVAGVWIGVAPPDAVSSLSAGLWGETISMPLWETDILAGLEGEL